MSKKGHAKKIDVRVETVQIDEKLYEKAKKEQASREARMKSARGWGLGQGVAKGSRRLFG